MIRRKHIEKQKNVGNKYLYHNYYHRYFVHK